MAEAGKPKVGDMVKGLGQIVLSQNFFRKVERKKSVLEQTFFSACPIICETRSLLVLGDLRQHLLNCMSAVWNRNPVLFLLYPPEEEGENAIRHSARCRNKIKFMLRHHNYYFRAKQRKSMDDNWSCSFHLSKQSTFWGI